MYWRSCTFQSVTFLKTIFHSQSLGGCLIVFSVSHFVLFRLETDEVPPIKKHPHFKATIKPITGAMCYLQSTWLQALSRGKAGETDRHRRPGSSCEITTILHLDSPGLT